MSIYDAEFVSFNQKAILYFELNIKLSDYKKDIGENNLKFSSLYDDTVSISINFDNCNIGSIRFNFNVLKSVDTLNMIKLLEETLELVDIIFNILNADLNNVNIKSRILTEPAVYSIINGDNIIKDSSSNKRELFGVAWRHEKYAKFDNNIVNDVMKNNIPILRGDTFLVTTVSTLMLFQDKKYVKNRIDAIEIFWRQRYLLKKIDFEISKLLRKISKPQNGDSKSDFKNKSRKNKENDISSNIEVITSTQKSLNSDLEVYRNTVVSVMHTYTSLFKTLNDVFDMDKHYSFVKAKMEACKRIYQQLYDKQQSEYEKERKNLMYNIQWVVLILGFLALISAITVGVYGSELKIIPNLSIFIAVLAIFTIVFYCLYNYKKYGSN